jgi:signal transduction histidine kinase
MSDSLPARSALEAELSQLAARCAALEKANHQLVKINEALMDRAERDLDRQGSSYSLFQSAIALESKVNERTDALRHTLRTLEQTNRDLKESNEAALAANRAKSAFLAAMSHELRTPMNGIIGMSELLMSSQMTTAHHKSVDTIRRSALSLLGILNDILDFSKIEAGQLKPEATAFKLRSTTDQALALLQPQIDGKGLTLIVDWPDELPDAVVGDPTRYAQVVNNLMGNAIKFTAQGSITLRARMQQQDNSLLYRFEVQDTGIGISADVIPKLFNSFTQADSTTTRQFGGTGLGLAIVLRLCQLMGGSCGVNSEPGQGSCFWFSIALQRDLQPESHLSSGSFKTFKPPVRNSHHQRRILVVEDNLINQEVASALLETLGVTCSLAENGRIALEMLTKPHHFDLVLMDCQMPEMDGFEATRQIRRHESGRGAHVPIVALTANAMVGDRELCLAAGMDDFLSKPFQLKQLADLLNKWCPQQHARRFDQHEMRA